MINNYQAFRDAQKSFISKEGEIKYIDQGGGTPIVLLHGVPSSGWLYRKMIAPLNQLGYRIIVPDMLGFGSSANPKGYEIYSEANHAKRLLALLDALGVSNWLHVMHDAGGLWTWELIKIAPHRIKKIMILNTIILEAGFQPPIRMEPGPFTQFTMWLYRNGITTKLLLNALFKHGLIENNLSDSTLEGYKRPLLEGKTRALYYFFSQTCNKLPDYRSVLEACDIPAAVTWGKYDEMLEWTPQASAVQKLLDITDDQVHLIEAKHFIQEEQTSLIVETLNHFFKDS